LLALATTAVNAQDWTMFLGPDRNSKSPQKGLLRTWADGEPAALWSVGLGRGYGGPVVKNGKVYLLDRDDEKGDIMRCFDLASGDELWQFAYDSPGEVPFPGSRSVPAVDDRYVYSCGTYGDLYCFDLNSHQPVWKKNIWTDFGGGERLPVWAISQCPTIYGELLIISSQAPDAGVVAYNRNTGEVVWKTPNLGNENYASPTVLKIHGEDQVVMVNSSTNPFANPNAPATKGKVVGLDPMTGAELWRYDNWECHITCAPPTLADDNKLLIVGGYERGATLIQINKAADGKFSVAELFTTTDFGDQTKSALYHNGCFYAMYRTNQKRDGMVCMDINGKLLWKTGNNPNFDRGSMILADGLILATDGMKTLYLIEPDATGFKPISKANVLSEGGASTGGMSAMGGNTQNWAAIALADGKLLVRDQAKMVCVKVVK
jgi:outer membrane protein assembly factor BamB